MRPQKGIYGQCAGVNGQHHHLDGCDGTKNSICKNYDRSLPTKKENNTKSNPATNAEPYRTALSECHAQFPGQRVGKTQREWWELKHPGKKWSDLRTAQEAIEVGEEEIFSYSTREAEDYVPPAPPPNGAVVNPTVVGRKGSRPTTVVLQHESDEVILYRLLGGKKEEDWRDFTDPVQHIVREYKPKLSKEIVADAIGKLVQGANSYKRRYGVAPSTEFITRVKIDAEVLEDIHAIGAKAFQLTKKNELVEMRAQ